MNQNLQSSASSGRGLCPEDVVIIVVVGIGFVGSVIIYGLDLPPIMVAVFLATGVASLVYRFLGGIQSATFNIGPVKLAGTIAALISCAYFIDMQLEQWYRDKLFDPKVNGWFAINYDGIPVGVEIKVARDSIKIPPLDTLADNALYMKQEDHEFMVLSKDSAFILGSVSDHVLSGINLFNTMQKELGEFVVTGPLRAKTSNVDLGLIPFKLSTGTYGDNRSPYTLSDNAGDSLEGGSIRGKYAEIKELEGKYYLVGVVEVNHTLKESSYAKFVVGEIVPEIKHQK